MVLRGVEPLGDAAAIDSSEPGDDPLPHQLIDLAHRAVSLKDHTFQETGLATWQRCLGGSKPSHGSWGRHISSGKPDHENADWSPSETNKSRTRLGKVSQCLRITMKHVYTYIPTVRYQTPLPFHYITLHYIALPYILFHSVPLYHITLDHITFHYIALHCITLHYITLMLHYITWMLHYILRPRPWKRNPKWMGWWTWTKMSSHITCGHQPTYSRHMWFPESWGYPQSSSIYRWEFPLQTIQR